MCAGTLPAMTSLNSKVGIQHLTFGSVFSVQCFQPPLAPNDHKALHRTNEAPQNQSRSARPKEVSIASIRAVNHAVVVNLCS